VAEQVVEMDYDEIQKVADNFKEDAEKCRMIAKVLEGVIAVLKASFFAQIFMKKLIDWLEGIKKALENLAKVDEEFSGDLEFAIARHKEGDYQGMSRFGT
jgi:hypothetical protein